MNSPEQRKQDLDNVLAAVKLVSQDNMFLFMTMIALRDDAIVSADIANDEPETLGEFYFPNGEFNVNVDRAFSALESTNEEFEIQDMDHLISQYHHDGIELQEVFIPIKLTDDEYRADF